MMLHGGLGDHARAMILPNPACRGMSSMDCAKIYSYPFATPLANGDAKLSPLHARAYKRAEAALPHPARTRMSAHELPSCTSRITTSARVELQVPDAHKRCPLMPASTARSATGTSTTTPAYGRHLNHDMQPHAFHHRRVPSARRDLVPWVCTRRVHTSRAFLRRPAPALAQPRARR